jgi:DNA-binding response OmpR family regulator
VVRVLIACSDADARDAFEEALQQAGISVIPAPPDLIATLKLARRQRPDVVLLDVALPGVSGVAGLGKLAAEAPDAHLARIVH